MIDDRFDITLECIRRHYELTTKTGDMRSVSSSPLGAVLARYADFFSLFESFEGYVNFFLLQDLVAPETTSQGQTFTPAELLTPVACPEDIHVNGNVGHLRPLALALEVRRGL